MIKNLSTSKRKTDKGVRHDKAALTVSMHCPLCDSVSICGQGQIPPQDGRSLIEYRCIDCGELFFVHDRREGRPEIDSSS